ncbi:MAG TPA: four helix bundle protein [Fulvivirga sp.]|nr:four helix bundle protein [Fulvivirga sp.]
MSKERKFDLEERLISYSVQVIKIIDNLPNNRAAAHLGSQLIRSSSSPALNYGEVLAAESRKDFIHKMKIVLKELRESLNCLKILTRAGYLSNDLILDESNQLISIFVKSLETAKKNSDK